MCFLVIILQGNQSRQGLILTPKRSADNESISIRPTPSEPVAENK